MRSARRFAFIITFITLNGCYLDGDNASRLTSFTAKNKDSLVLVGLSNSARGPYFSGVALVRINPATRAPYPDLEDVIRFGRSDFENNRRTRKPTYVVVKARSGLYAFANYYYGSANLHERHIVRITGKTQSFEIQAGQLNYLGDYMIAFASDPPPPSKTVTIGKSLHYLGHRTEAAKLALTGFSAVHAPFAVMTAGTTKLE